MAGMATSAARPDARSMARRLVRPTLDMGRRRCVAVVLGSRPDPDRCLLPAPKPWPAPLAEGRRVVAQPPDPAWRCVFDPPGPGFVALAPRPCGCVRRGCPQKPR